MIIMTDDFDPDKSIEKMSKGVVLKLKAKRGTGTRDQDTVVGKVKDETVGKAKAKSDELADAMKERLDDLRQMNPERDSDE